MPFIIGAHIYFGDGIFEFECQGNRFVVDVVARTCGCRKWDVTGIPCEHAISATLYHRCNLTKFLSQYYSKDNSLKVYQPIIYPMPSEDNLLEAINQILNHGRQGQLLVVLKR